MKAETNTLTDWQVAINAGNIYDSIPARLLNKKATYAPPQDAIVRLK